MFLPEVMPGEKMFRFIFLGAALSLLVTKVALGAGVPYSVEFTVKVPAHTPQNTIVHITVQNGEGGWVVPPTPMTEIEEGVWRYTTDDLNMSSSFLNFGDDLEYMYSRNGWGEIGAEELVPDQFFGRRVQPSSDGVTRVSDEIVNWRWLPMPGFEMPSVQSAVGETSFKPRVGNREFQSGHSFIDFWGGDYWFPLLSPTHAAMRQKNATWVRIAPSSDYQQISPTPLISQEKRGNSHSLEELEAHIRRAKADGLKVLLTPLICCNFSPQDLVDVSKSPEWWSDWLEQFEAYVTYYVDVAVRLDVDAISIRGDTHLIGIDQPADFPEKLHAIYSRERAKFEGLWGRHFSTGWQRGEFPLGLYPKAKDAVFLEEADFIALKIWAGPATSADSPQSEITANMVEWERSVLRPIFNQYETPVVLSEVAFSTTDGGLMGEQSESESERHWELYSDAHQLDLAEQAMGYEATMNMVAQTDYIIGVYPFQYWPEDFPLNSGYDVRGKPAENVLSGWYAKANAQNPGGSPSAFHLSLEEPVDAEIHTGVGNLRGWAVGDAGIDKIEMWIDGVYAFDVPYGGVRRDVGGAFPDITGSDESGFSMAYSYSSLSSGVHSATAVAYDSLGNAKQSVSTEFSVVKLAEDFIGDPNAVNLNGASCSLERDEITLVDALISDEPVDLLLKWRTAEQGFEIIEVRGGGSAVAVLMSRQALPVFTESANTETSGSVFRAVLEEPVQNETHSGVGNLRGWAIASDGVEKIEIFIDGEYQFDAPYGGARQDVAGAFPDVSGSKESGFSLAFNYNNLSAGQHDIEAVAHSNQGVKERSSSTFNVVKFSESFINSSQSVDLNGADCVTGGTRITISDAVVAGDTYDMVLDWRVAEQGFEIVEIR